MLTPVLSNNKYTYNTVINVLHLEELVIKMDKGVSKYT